MLPTPTRHIDRDEFENIQAELACVIKTRRAEVVTITCGHEDHGRGMQRRKAGVFTIKADELAFVRDAFAPTEAAD